MLRQILKQLGVYERIRYGRLFSWYQNKFQPEKIADAKREVRFYSSFLPRIDLVFDIGGHDGHKTEALLHLSNKVVCCEPDGNNFRILRRRFCGRKDRVYLENVAVGEAEGITDMYVHHEGSAFNTLNRKFKEVLETDGQQKWGEEIRFSKQVQVFVTTIDRLIGKYGRPAFIKIDTEGYEWAVVKGLTVPVSCLSLECLLPEFRQELELIIDHLALLSSCEYNIAIGEELQWKGYRARSEVENFLRDTPEHHFELIVRMKTSAPL